MKQPTKISICILYNSQTKKNVLLCRFYIGADHFTTIALAPSGALGRNLSIDNGDKDVYVLDKKVLIQIIVSSTVILKSYFLHFKHLFLIDSLLRSFKQNCSMCEIPYFYMFPECII